jgi:hypothetical protein
VCNIKDAHRIHIWLSLLACHAHEQCLYELDTPCVGWYMSLYFDDSSHRDGLSKELVGEQRWVPLGIGQWRHDTYPGSGPSSLEVKTLRPALVFIISTRWLTVLLELCCLEEEDEVFDPPILRVQAPLYRQGPGYKVSSGCPAAGFSVVVALAQVPLPSAPLPGRRLLYKVPLSPGPTYPGYMPPARLRSFRGEGVCLVRLVEAVRGWRHSGLQPLPLLSGPYKL